MRECWEREKWSQGVRRSCQPDAEEATRTFIDEINKFWDNT